MARFRKKALNNMSVWELSSLLDTLTNKRHALDVEISEVLGYIQDSKVMTEVIFRDNATGVKPYQHQHDDLFV
jgi:hypothetical protein